MVYLDAIPKIYPGVLNMHEINGVVVIILYNEYVIPLELNCIFYFKSLIAYLNGKLSNFRPPQVLNFAKKTGCNCAQYSFIFTNSGQFSILNSP